MSRAEELESAVVGEDSIRPRGSADQERVGLIALGVDSGWNRRVQPSSDCLDATCGQMVFELIARTRQVACLPTSFC